MQVCSAARLTMLIPQVVLGYDAIQGGIRTLPFTLVSAFSSIVAGITLNKTQKYRPIVRRRCAAGSDVPAASRLGPQCARLWSVDAVRPPAVDGRARRAPNRRGRGHWTVFANGARGFASVHAA